MFPDLQNAYDWVLPVVRYSTEESLVAAFEDWILTPALTLRPKLNERKAKRAAEVDLDAMLARGHTGQGATEPASSGAKGASA
jgi:hypothetical protein